MKYQCKECGAKIKALSQGRCSACGSSKLTGLQHVGRTAPANNGPVNKTSSAKKILLVLLWALLIYKAYDSLFHSLPS